jgi:hypothetical protein
MSDIGYLLPFLPEVLRCLLLCQTIVVRLRVVPPFFPATVDSIIYPAAPKLSTLDLTLYRRDALPMPAIETWSTIHTSTHPSIQAVFPGQC